MAKKHKHKRRAPVVVVNVSEHRAGAPMILGQLIAGGLVFGGLAYLAASRPPASAIGFAARHPRAVTDYGLMKANEAAGKLKARGKAFLERLKRDRREDETIEASAVYRRPPALPGTRRE